MFATDSAGIPVETGDHVSVLVYKTKKDTTPTISPYKIHYNVRNGVFSNKRKVLAVDLVNEEYMLLLRIENETKWVPSTWVSFFVPTP